MPLQRQPVAALDSHVMTKINSWHFIEDGGGMMEPGHRGKHIFNLGGTDYIVTDISWKATVLT